MLGFKDKKGKFHPTGNSNRVQGVKSSTFNEGKTEHKFLKRSDWDKLTSKGNDFSMDDADVKHILRGSDFHGLPKNIIQKRIQLSKNTINAIKKDRAFAKFAHGRETDVSHYDEMLKFESDRLKNAEHTLKVS